MSTERTSNSGTRLGKCSHSDLKAVVIGGGTGAPVSIKTLLSMGIETAAVVAMADDGGSSGLLREHTGAVPPGDIRKCLAAMAAHPDDPFVRAFKYRFDYLNNHTLGNLILTALADTTSSFPEAIRICEGLLQAKGHVYPSTLENVVLVGRTRDGRSIRGQANIGKSDTALETVHLTPSAPAPYPPALDAIREADLIVLGPGSLFTSIIPNLLVPGIVDAIRESNARTVFLCSLADMQGETWGLDSAEHVTALLEHGMRGLLDVVVIHHYHSGHTEGNVTAAFAAVTGGATPTDRDKRTRAPGSIRHVAIDKVIAARIESQGPAILARDLVDPLRPTWHDPQALHDVFEGVLSSCPSPQR